MNHIVMFSGGIGSWLAAKRIVSKVQEGDRFVLLFSDVKGNTDNPHIGEDEDTYRFIQDAAKNVGGELIILKDGRDIWQLFSEQKFLGNSRVANCSKMLKQRPARNWLKENCDPLDTTIYVGIDWTEMHRLPAIIKNYKPYLAVAPLIEPPYIDKETMIKMAKAEGLQPPRLYSLGFAHNNCGGGCVRAGQAQFKKLYETIPERFKVWEEKEQQIINEIGKPVSILTEMVNGEKKQLPLTELRRRIEEKNSQIDELDFGGCGCFFESDEREDYSHDPL